MKVKIVPSGAKIMIINGIEDRKSLHKNVTVLQKAYRYIRRHFPFNFPLIFNEFLAQK